jgi:hypothetical protein
MAGNPRARIGDSHHEQHSLASSTIASIGEISAFFWLFDPNFWLPRSYRSR